MTALVTGGGGFLGGAIVRALRQRGWDVRSFTRTAYPWLEEFEVEQVLGDLADPEAVNRAVAGADVVFHAAAKAGVWGRAADFHATNVTGTENVLAACKAAGVRKLVYTSTPSVVHGGGDLEGANESVPYPTHFDAPYPETKALAEKAVLAANGPELATVALRPHLIWGPGDPHLVPRIIARAREGKLRRVGARPVTVDVTYIDNAAQAHFDAFDRLAPAADCAGRAYFISNGEPRAARDMVNALLQAAGAPPVTKTLPFPLAYAVGAACEAAWTLLPLRGEPPLTRFLAEQLATTHWYDMGPATRDLGYLPRVSIDEGLRRLAASSRGVAA